MAQFYLVPSQTKPQALPRVTLLIARAGMYCEPGLCQALLSALDCLFESTLPAYEV